MFRYGDTVRDADGNDHKITDEYWDRATQEYRYRVDGFLDLSEDEMEDHYTIVTEVHS